MVATIDVDLGEQRRRARARGSGRRAAPRTPGTPAQQRVGGRDVVGRDRPAATRGPRRIGRPAARAPRSTSAEDLGRGRRQPVAGPAGHGDDAAHVWWTSRDRRSRPILDAGASFGGRPRRPRQPRGRAPRTTRSTAATSRSATAAACSAVGASTMTRTSGSVPLGRTSTRPRRPARPRPRRRRAASRSTTPASLPGTAHVAQHLGQPGHRPTARSASGRPVRRHHVEQLEAGEQRRRRWWPGRGRSRGPTARRRATKPPASSASST